MRRAGCGRDVLVKVKCLGMRLFELGWKNSSLDMRKACVSQAARDGVSHCTAAGVASPF